MARRSYWSRRVFSRWLVLTGQAMQWGDGVVYPPVCSTVFHYYVEGRGAEQALECTLLCWGEMCERSRIDRVCSDGLPHNKDDSFSSLLFKLVSSQ